MSGVTPAHAPMHFTVEFRRKMAQLPIQVRKDWLASLAVRVREAPVSADQAQELREVARACRLPLLDAIQAHLGAIDPLQLRAMLEVPRERFVRLEDLERCAEDTPLPLDDEGRATISAPHAYLLSFRLLELGPGDSLVELGSGSGYGAALASFIVGPKGHVRTLEIDGRLAAWARRNLEDLPGVELEHADATRDIVSWRDASKVVVTFAVRDVPQAWLDALPESGSLVTPVGPPDGEQVLVLYRRENGRIVRTEHGSVRDVPKRSGE